MAAEVGTRGGEMILQGDCIEVMKSIKPNSVDTIVTDPPYNLHFMGKDWDKGLIHEKWLTEAFRVMRPGSSLLAMGGTRTFHRMACAIEDTGFIIKDCLMWIYGQGFPKAQDLGKMIDKREGAERVVKIRVRVKGGGTEYVNRSNYTQEYRPGDYQKGGNILDVTSPSTDLAKHWDGFKIGGIKPAWESIIWAYKPLTDIELFSIMVHKIKELLCLI
ncbi:MAG TPA: DNA methyltransferase, partial [Dehalococcoidia bacterium]|nr:DNA methyltransferase [Dehalococcoidia bacterium]